MDTTTETTSSVAAAPADYSSSEARQQHLIPTPPLMHVMKYMTPSVLVLVTLKYQPKPQTLFLENLAPILGFVAANSIYWLTVGAMKQMTTAQVKCLEILSNVAVASGVLSALSMVSIFMPYPVSLVPLMIWIPLPLVFAWPILYNAYNLLKRGVTIVIDKIKAIVIWEREEASSNLPV